MAINTLFVAGIGLVEVTLLIGSFWLAGKV